MITATWIGRTQGRIQDFKLGGALKKIAPTGGRRENFLGSLCEKSRFYAIFFFSILGGGRAPGAPLPPWDLYIDLYIEDRGIRMFLFQTNVDAH